MALHFREDGTFRVLQMADIQDGPNVNKDTIRLIKAAIDAARPDLVVLTGDQIRGYDPAYIDTFLHRRGGVPGQEVRLVTKLEAGLRGIKRRAALDDAHNGASTDASAATGTGTPANTSANTPTDATASMAELMAELMDETRQKVRDTFSAFLGPAIAAHVPFAATYGNHDFQCGILADEQDDIYREYPGCLNPDSRRPAAENASADAHSPADPAEPIAFEPGTFALPVMASDGSNRIAMSVVMVNSGDYADKPSERPASNPADRGTSESTIDHAGYAATNHATQSAAYRANSRGLDLADSDGYGTPSPEAIAWLGTVQRELVSRNGDGEPVPSIAFQHIPPQEFYDCLTEVPMWTPNAVEGTRSFAGHCYVINRAVCRPGSRLGEGIGCADENVGEIAAMREAGGYFALFCGHDHKNSFVGHADGIDLGYAPTCGFESYGPKSRLRGIRLFEFDESDPSTYMTRMLTWGELVGRYSHNEPRVFIEDHCPTDSVSIRNELRRPTVFATVALSTLACLRGIVRSILRRAHRRNPTA